jgi:hypothetical protein
MFNTKRVSYWPVIVLAFLISSCGGGGSDDGGTFENQGIGEVSVSITADKTTLSTNPNDLGPDPALPYTNTITVRVQSPDGTLVPSCIAIDVTPSLANGALYYLDGDPEHEVKDRDGKPTGVPAAYRRLIFGCETQQGSTSQAPTTGIVTAHFHAFDVPGTVILTASATDPNTNRSVSANLPITVSGGTGPVTSLTFTGPFVNAVLANRINFGTVADTILQNGTYSRVISVIANNASGNPVAQRTPINFYVIDAPLTGFPNLGAGSFAIAGSDGNPAEGGFFFTAANGNFISKGTRASDRLVLDGTKTTHPDNRELTGIRIIENVFSQTELLIEQSGMPFASNPADNGPTVPYIVGRAQHATILTPMFTDVTGTATTFLNYPAAHLGQTAVLVACTADNAICTVLNTCDAQGGNCGAVYLGVTDGTDVRLTSSLATLPPNTSSQLELCVKDRNFAPIHGDTISYEIGAFGSATVSINGSAARSGTLLSGGNGCVTANITTSGQVPGSAPIQITFNAINAQPLVVNVSGPGTGTLELLQQCDLEELMAYRRTLQRYQQCLATGSVEECGAPPIPPLTVTCTYDLRLVDDLGGPIPDIVVSYTAEGKVPNRIDFNPASGEFGITNTRGQVRATVEYQTGGETTITFKAGAAETKVTLNTAVN